ncbi:hypothetical protein NQ156_10020 [Microbacterium sp. zg.Y625]|uniref:hypothetical protein n=1 Tax=Microbacterium jiangjiandongii TaxID=3049071 RepID=UPI00214AE470|nr:MULTISPECIES: hypothetical protein [unclassified Microbacterium]MCR2793395.1 hypothetical protein [Microbacterium sp. zg.Y625]WIM25234.1 hypothetical protein QNO14_14045 [Microbacterium sp. zg-Y625]
MPEGATLAVSRLRVASVGLSVAALALFAMGMLLSWSRMAVLIVPVVLGVVALVLAIRARGSAAARPGRAIAFLMSALAMIAPALAIGAVLLAPALAPSAVYTITVDSPEPVDVVIREGADSTSAAWDSGDTITLDSNATVIGIAAHTSTPTTVISCEIRRHGKILAAEERAGSVNCSFVEGEE